MKVGDPICATDHSTISQASIQLLRDLHSSTDSIWNLTITSAIVERLNQLPQVMSKIAASEDNVVEDQDNSGRYQLLTDIWPALAVISGVDEGIRMGSKCRMKDSAKTGVLLGVTQDSKMRMQWDEMSDVSINIYLLVVYLFDV